MSSFIHRGIAIVLCAAGLSVSYSHACGQSFPNAYFVDGREYTILELPESSFFTELSRILGERPKWHYAPGEKPKTQWERMLDADRADLDEALKAHGVDDASRNNLTSKFLELRALMAPPQPEGVPSRPKPDLGDSAESPQPEIDVSPYTEMLTAIPQEFALYVKGAVKFHAGDPASASEAWNAILALPEDQRKYRSTWAAFMLGRVAMRVDLVQAEEHFEHVRELAQNGYRDSLHLASDSMGYVAMFELAAGNYAPAMKLYAEMLAKGPREGQYIGYDSLRTVCSRACGPTIDTSIAADPLCRQIMSAWVMSHPGAPELSAIWNKALADAGVTGVIPDAGNLAWAAYSAGDIPTAQKWIDAAAPDSLYAKWVRSKLLMRDGKIDEAVAILRELAKAFPVSESSFAYDNDYQMQQTSALDAVRADLSVLLLGRGDYINAFDLLVRSQYWTDAAYIAERVLTVDELAEYLAQHAEDKELEKQKQEQWLFSDGERITRYDVIRYVLARRCMRIGKYDEALANFPPKLKPDAEKLVAELKASASPRAMGWSEWASTTIGDWWNGKTTPFIDRTRAEHCFAAAQLVREKGIGLMGTELEPDWYVYRGRIERDGATHHRAFDEEKTPALDRLRRADDGQAILAQANPAFKQVIQASGDEKNRVWDSAPPHNIRYTTRFIAADLMWQCAAQLPKNDALSLRALYWGGTYLKLRDPKAADKFYKAMVMRNWSMPFAQKANKLRWFPKEAPDANSDSTVHQDESASAPKKSVP